MNAPYRASLVMLVTAVVAAALFWLVRDHWRHSLGLLPYLLFLACPVMHLFMHRQHGARHHAHRPSLDNQNS